MTEMTSSMANSLNSPIPGMSTDEKGIAETISADLISRWAIRSTIHAMTEESCGTAESNSKANPPERIRKARGMAARFERRESRGSLWK